MDDGVFSDESLIYVFVKVLCYEQEKQIVIFVGDVVLCQGSMQVEGDEVNLYQLENCGELVGNVKLCDKGMLVVGDYVQVQLDNGEVQVDNVEYVIYKVYVCGSVFYVKCSENVIIMFKDGIYICCELSSNVWILKGNNVKLNLVIGFGIVINVIFWVKDFLVFYILYIYFLIDDCCQFGFLLLSFSSISDIGFILVILYYFNLVLNYDVMLYLCYMVKCGMMLEGEFCYLIYSSEGIVNVVYLNDKDDYCENFLDYSKDCWLYGFKNIIGFDLCWLVEVDYMWISDFYYFQDLDFDLGVGSMIYFNQWGMLIYCGDIFIGQLNV